MTAISKSLMTLALSSLHGDEAAKQLLEKYVADAKAFYSLIKEVHAKAEELSQNDQKSVG
jgi:hypothetical protein